MTAAGRPRRQAQGSLGSPKIRVLLAFIVLFGFFARASTYKVPLLDHHGWRQADTASIARNFLRERFNLFYPQIDQRGARADGDVETGLELFAFTVAAIAMVAGFHPEIGRLLSSACFMVSCLLVWRFVRHRDDDETALVAAFLHAFAFPLLLFIERAFMNESLLVCLSLVCLVTAQGYLARRSTVSLLVLITASSLIAAIKLPYLIIWAPIAGLFVEADGLRVVRRWELWLIAVVNLGVAAAWYTHAHHLAQVTGLSFGLTDKLFDAATVFSLDYPLVLLDRMTRDLLEPIGLLAVVIGTALAIRRRRWCEIFGLLGFGAYLVLVALGNITHDYYQLALMPIAAVLGASGILWLGGRLGDRLAGSARRDVAVAALLGLAAFCTFVRLVSAHSWFEYSPDDLVMCEALKRASAQDDRLLFIGDNNPQMLFCVDRKGWLLADAESTESRIHDAREGGARLAVLTKSLRRADVSRALADAGPPILTSPTLQVYRLP